MLAEVSLHVSTAAYRQRDAVIGLILKMRDKLQLNVPIICAVEAAPGISAATIQRDIQESGIPDCCVLHESSDFMPGVVKTNAVTYEYLVEFKKILESGTLSYWKDMITEDGIEAADVRKTLETQMANLQAVPLNKNQLDGDKRYKITAKIGGSPDDLLVSAMMCQYWGTKFWQRKAYSEYQQKILKQSRLRFPRNTVFG